MEDAIPSTARHGTARGLPLKEVLEYVIPELSVQCLRQASSSPKVSEQLLKLDEQGVCITEDLCVCVCVRLCVHVSECFGDFPHLSRSYIFNTLKHFLSSFFLTMPLY